MIGRHIPRGGNKNDQGRSIRQKHTNKGAGQEKNTTEEESIKEIVHSHKKMLENIFLVVLVLKIPRRGTSLEMVV